MEEKVNCWTIDGKVILVTGGAAGIGAGLVRSLLTLNARHVAFLDVLEREGGALEGELLNKFGALRAKFIKCDISDEEQLSAAYSQVLDKYRRLDAVINNAAVICDKEGFYKKTVDVNFTATVTSTLKAMEAMRADRGGGGGVVINTSSLLALKQTSHSPVYTATKTAVLQFSNYIATQESYDKTKVRVITVCLGPTDTVLLYRHNSKDPQNIAQQAPERQRVTSAVTGIMDVISRAGSGSTWIIAGDKLPVDVTRNVREGFQIISMATDFV
ncbi:15-hydroxyprostaglandin dehydrogenase [NAD(+)]-like [Vanessa tameamea]|uniref:15-hydroxyprostaglandin dehydrogenase [NAD(+)] n=1 Tax=Vanessa tameamea TaxID=334116 RepID=A0A8B8ICL4_VANTA